MARPKKVVPSYLLHAKSGQARVKVGDRYVYLGPHGSPESVAEYNRLCAELVAGRPDPAAPPATPYVTVNEVLVAFLRHADEHYRREDGTPTNEVVECRLAARVVRQVYGSTPARAFGPAALKAVRRAMVDGGLCRTTTNNWVRRIRHLFRWAAGEELVPPAVPLALAAAAGLQKGRTAAPEPDPVGPLADGLVAATLPVLSPTVRAMVEVQRLTGMRPQGVCHLWPCDVDASGPVWVYRSPQHKTAHRGKPRAVAIGSRAQAVLAAFTPADPAAYYFSPRAAVAHRWAAQAAGRRTPCCPSHVVRNAGKRKTDPMRAPAGRYTTHAYYVAVRRAAARAGVPHWHSNQLRHAHGTEVRKQYGLEAAQVALGHEKADTTELYAERNLTLAARVAAEIG